jgi:hypothetical protein
MTSSFLCRVVSRGDRFGSLCWRCCPPFSQKGFREEGAASCVEMKKKLHLPGTSVGDEAGNTLRYKDFRHSNFSFMAPHKGHRSLQKA